VSTGVRVGLCAAFYRDGWEVHAAELLMADGGERMGGEAVLELRQLQLVFCGERFGQDLKVFPLIR